MNEDPWNNTLRDYLATIRRRRGVIALITLTGVVVALVVSLIQSRTYTAEASFRVKDPPGAAPADLQNGWTPPDLGAGAQFALQARLLYAIDEHFLYLGGELEPGYVLSEARYAYGTLSPTMSLFLGDWIEVRINPIGLHWMQELTGKGFVAALYGTVGVVVRFLDP